MPAYLLRDALTRDRARFPIGFQDGLQAVRVMQATAFQRLRYGA
jgi:hypothetical protein